jgi:hypothetical protein
LQESAFSAFGSTSPIHDPGGERIRWFCPWLISGRSVLLKALDNLAGWEDRVSVSRVTARMVSAGELTPGCEELLSDRGFRVEAGIAMGGARKLVISYIGKCGANRRSDADDFRQEKLLLDGILAQDRKAPAKIVSEFDHLNDFHVETVASDSLSPADIERLVSMHGETFPTFPYDFRKKLGIMRRNPGIYLMVVVRSLLDGQVYAFSNLELNTLTLDDGTRLCLAEYDNTMRLTSCPGHRAVSGLGGILRLQLARLAVRNEADVCHAESRAGLAAINCNSHQLGMQFGGALEKHLLISGQSDINYKASTRFETMNVWYLNRQDLMGIEADLVAGMEKTNRD